jgi:hypothetical protein
MTWLDWLRVVALAVAFIGIFVAALAGLFLLLSKPLGEGPERIVDIENRGETRIRMPDGTIK